MFKITLAILVTMLISQAAHAQSCPKVLDASYSSLMGESVDLCDYSGKVVLAVNTASFCGNTRQYKGLEELYQKYKDRGLVVIGFPANNFGGQEPGTNEEIKEFCEVNYGVSFTMVEKTSVIGSDINPTFAELKRMTGETPGWNFHKYLISRDGTEAASFTASMRPNNKKLIAQLEAFLK